MCILIHSLRQHRLQRAFISCSSNKSVLLIFFVLVFFVLLVFEKHVTRLVANGSVLWIQFHQSMQQVLQKLTSIIPRNQSLYTLSSGCSQGSFTRLKFPLLKWANQKRTMRSLIVHAPYTTLMCGVVCVALVPRQNLYSKIKRNLAISVFDFDQNA